MRSRRCLPVWSAPAMVLASVAVMSAALAPPADADRPAATRTPCYTPTSVRTIARAAHVRRASVRVSRSIGHNGMPQCSFKARNRGPDVVVNVDDGPQAAFRLARAVEEATQIFGPEPPGWHPPIGLMGLGPSASWFPELGSLMALSTNSVDLVTVHVVWPHASRNAKIALARRLILPFVHRAKGSTKDKSPDFRGNP